MDWGDAYRELVQDSVLLNAVEHVEQHEDEWVSYTARYVLLLVAHVASAEDEMMDLDGREAENIRILLYLIKFCVIIYSPLVKRVRFFYVVDLVGHSIHDHHIASTLLDPLNPWATFLGRSTVVHPNRENP